MAVRGPAPAEPSVERVRGGAGGADAAEALLKLAARHARARVLEHELVGVAPHAQPTARRRDVALRQRQEAAALDGVRRVGDELAEALELVGVDRVDQE